MNAKVQQGGPVAYEWLPGALLAIAGGGASWWKASEVARGELEKSVAVAKIELAKSIEQIKNELAAGARSSERNDDEFKRDLYDAVKELRAVTVTLATLTSGQSVINAVNAKALEAIARKQEEHDKTLAELGATTTLITEWLKRLEGR